MAIARGATSAIAIEWPEEEMLLTPAIAPTVVGLARDHAVDLVMTGVQTSEDILGQAAPFIGGLLGWPHVSGTSRIVSEGPGKLVVAQERGGGFVASYRITTPAVLGVQTASSPPRYRPAQSSGRPLERRSTSFPSVKPDRCFRSSRWSRSKEARPRRLALHHSRLPRRSCAF
jgi:electron transfer flavoprotein alpha/beta subunit